MNVPSFKVATLADVYSGGGYNTCGVYSAAGTSCSSTSGGSSSKVQNPTGSGSASSGTSRSSTQSIQLTQRGAPQPKAASGTGGWELWLVIVLTVIALSALFIILAGIWRRRRRSSD